MGRHRKRSPESALQSAGLSWGMCAGAPAPAVLGIPALSWGPEGLQGPRHGEGAVSALGSGRACPTAVIAFCPSGQYLARPQYDS